MNNNKIIGKIQIFQIIYQNGHLYDALQELLGLFKENPDFLNTAIIRVSKYGTTNLISISVPWENPKKVL